MKIFTVALIFALMTGCSWTPKYISPAEEKSGYTYIPIDPFRVDTAPGLYCVTPPPGKSIAYQKLPKGLPDNAVRMLVEEFDAEGRVTYGPAKAETSNKSYRVTTDFISADTLNFQIKITKSAQLLGGIVEPVPFDLDLDGNFYKARSESYTVSRVSTSDSVSETPFTKVFNVPVYVGIGLRVTADIVTNSAKANVTGLGVIGAEADAGNLKGSLIVQTLGVNGKAVTAALPIQSELNRTTAQNAIVAVASIKTLLHADETDIAPRVVGIYLPFAGGKPLVNAIISELSKTPLTWERPCIPST